MKKNELDRRRKYYLILDCETATLPYAAKFTNSKAKQRVSIAKPLIYDIGWTVVDKKGNIYKKKSFLISEIFFFFFVFNTAYYVVNRPIYFERLKCGAIDLVTCVLAISELVHDMELVEGVGAYNAMFDFKKAIPFTELYINQLYSPNFNKWEEFQNSCCDEIVNGYCQSAERQFEPDIFRFRGKAYKLFDVWGLTCIHLRNNDEYKRDCIANEWKTESGQYFKTAAETAFRFCADTSEFEEEHTALSDAEIESFLFGEAVKRNKGKFEFGIIFFPFRELGTVEAF